MNSASRRWVTQDQDQPVSLADTEHKGGVLGGLASHLGRTEQVLPLVDHARDRAQPQRTAPCEVAGRFAVALVGLVDALEHCRATMTTTGDLITMINCPVSVTVDRTRSAGIASNLG